MPSKVDAPKEANLGKMRRQRYEEKAKGNPMTSMNYPLFSPLVIRYVSIHSRQ